MNASRPDPRVAIAVTVGGALAVVGCFLPWVVAQGPYVDSASENGIDAGTLGILTIVGSVALIAVGISAFTDVTRPKAFGITVLVLGLVDGLLLWRAFEKAHDAAMAVNGSDSLPIGTSASIGVGLYLVTIGILVALVAVLIASLRASSSRTAAASSGHPLPL